MLVFAAHNREATAPLALRDDRAQGSILPCFLGMHPVNRTAFTHFDHRSPQRSIFPNSLGQVWDSNATKLTHLHLCPIGTHFQPSVLQIGPWMESSCWAQESIGNRSWTTITKIIYLVHRLELFLGTTKFPQQHLSSAIKGSNSNAQTKASHPSHKIPNAVQVVSHWIAIGCMTQARDNWKNQTKTLK